MPICSDLYNNCVANLLTSVTSCLPLRSFWLQVEDSALQSQGRIMHCPFSALLSSISFHLSDWVKLGGTKQERKLHNIHVFKVNHSHKGISLFSTIHIIIVILPDYLHVFTFWHNHAQSVFKTKFMVKSEVKRRTTLILQCCLMARGWGGFWQGNNIVMQCESLCVGGNVYVGPIG